MYFYFFYIRIHIAIPHAIENQEFSLQNSNINIPHILNAYYF